MSADDSIFSRRDFLFGAGTAGPAATAVGPWISPRLLAEPDLLVLRAPATAKTRLDDRSCAVPIAEVLSPGTATRDRGIKRMLYQRLGVPEYSIVDLDARLIERWTPIDARPEILREQLTWTDPESGIDVAINVEQYFADVWGDESAAD